MKLSQDKQQELSVMVHDYVQVILEKAGVAEDKGNGVAFAAQCAFDNACLDAEV